MEILHGILLTCVLAAGFIAVLLIGIFRKKKIMYIISGILCAAVIASLIFTIDLGKKNMQEYTERTEQDGDAEYSEMDMEPVGYLVLQMQETLPEGVSMLPLRMYLTVTGYNDIEKEITAVISNQTGYAERYGNEYWLMKLEGDEWVNVEPETEYGWTKIAYELKDLEEAEVKYDLSVFGKLEPGAYKLCKDGMEAEFTLIEEWSE